MSAQGADAIAAAAADWVMRLSADDQAERAAARAGFERWKAADPRHAEAGARLEGFLRHLQDLRGPDKAPARATLDATLARGARRRRNRTAAIVAVAVGLVLAVPAAMLLQAYPPSYLTADFRTGTGQWETRVLADGSRITLNGTSAVNLRFDAHARRLELVKGEVLVEVAPDAARPFVVETSDGHILALGTRFVVAKAEATDLSMLESRVAVQTAAQRGGADSTVVAAGQRVRITPAALGPVETFDARALADAWTYRHLVVQDRPLGDVLDELGRRRPGRILYDRAGIGGLTVSAVLPLDDTDRALRLLATSFGLRLREVTPWLVLVDRPATR